MSEKGPNIASTDLHQLSPHQSGHQTNRQSSLSPHAPRESSDQASTASGSGKSRWRKFLSQIKWLALDQWFLLALACLVLISSQVQVPRSQRHEKEIIVTYLCVAIIFIITGCTLPTKVLLDNYRRWKIHLFVQIQCFLVTSAIVFAVVSLCATSRTFMDAGLLLGLIFMGCVPTTISSNVVMTKQAHGNQALTVVQSTLGNFLGPFITPLLVEMYIARGAWYTKPLPEGGSFGELYKRIFIQLGLSIFLPLVNNFHCECCKTYLTQIQVVGQIIQNSLPKITKKVLVDWKLSKLSSFSLLIIIWQTYDQAFETGAFKSVKGNNIVFIVFISVVLYVIWSAICILLSALWLSKEDTVAVAYCVPAKTPAMGVPLATVMFAGLSPITSSKLQIPLVIYQGLQIAAGSILTIFFRKWVSYRQNVRASDDNALPQVLDPAS